MYERNRLRIRYASEKRIEGQRSKLRHRKTQLWATRLEYRRGHFLEHLAYRGYRFLLLCFRDRKLFRRRKRTVLLAVFYRAIRLRFRVGLENFIASSRTRNVRLRLQISILSAPFQTDYIQTIVNGVNILGIIQYPNERTLYGYVLVRTYA